MTNNFNQKLQFLLILKQDNSLPYKKTAFPTVFVLCSLLTFSLCLLLSVSIRVHP